ncbi:MAG: hypothetical protein ACYDC1_18530, partial [Limisphaerales bacterium]
MKTPIPGAAGWTSAAAGRGSWQAVRFALIALGLTFAFAQASEPTTPAGEALLIGSPEPGWPQWRGPKRDSRSIETGLMGEWPEAGPPRVWQAEGLGRGYSTPIVVGDRLFLAGDHEDELRIHALDLDGRARWS